MILMVLFNTVRRQFLALKRLSTRSGAEADKAVNLARQNVRKLQAKLGAHATLEGGADIEQKAEVPARYSARPDRAAGGSRETPGDRAQGHTGFAARRRPSYSTPATEQDAL